MSSDHPGIVARVSSIVEELGGNIVSCSQTVLDGYFTFITVVDLPQQYESNTLAQTIQTLGKHESRYQVLVQPYEDQPHQRQPDIAVPENTDVYIITAFGKDRSGIVKMFSGYLSSHDINITDLYARRKEDDFVLVGKLTIPDNINTRDIKDDLEELGKGCGFTVRVQHNNIFVATNQIRLAE
jgi:predicted amino acid-binding ACT domain protein